MHFYMASVESTAMALWSEPGCIVHSGIWISQCTSKRLQIYALKGGRTASLVYGLVKLILPKYKETPL